MLGTPAAPSSSSSTLRLGARERGLRLYATTCAAYHLAATAGIGVVTYAPVDVGPDEATTADLVGSDQAANRRRLRSVGGSPAGYDSDTYRDRNVIKRANNRFKQWRGLAIRYDKLATVYRGAAVLRIIIIIWLTG